jgi:hypothetical protein
MNKMKATTIWKFLQKVVNDHRPEPAALTIESFAHFLMQSFTFEDEEQAGKYLEYLAPDLVCMMQQKRRRTYEWTELPIYDELLEAKLSAAFKRKLAGVELKRRTQPLQDDEDDDEDDDDEISSVDSSEEEELVMDEEQMQHHTKSSLRPKSGSKFSGKGAGRRGKGIGNRGVVHIDEDGDSMDVDTPSKRKSIDGNEEDIPAKKRFTRSQGDQDPELEDLEFAWQQAKSTGLPIRHKSEQHQRSSNGNSTGRGLRPSIVSEPIFNPTATDPGDIWTCTYAGCLHRVYGASDEDSKDLIKEHLDEHKSDDKIGLILSEENRTQLPVRLAHFPYSFLLTNTIAPSYPFTPITTPEFRNEFLADKAESLAVLGDVAFRFYYLKAYNNEFFMQQSHQTNPRNGRDATRLITRDDPRSQRYAKSDGRSLSSTDHEEGVNIDLWLQEVKTTMSDGAPPIELGADGIKKLQTGFEGPNDWLECVTPL